MKTNSSLLLVLFFLFSNNLFAQNDRLIAPKKLKKDLKALVNFIEAHPKPYRHMTQEEHEALIKHCYKQIDAPMTEIAFFKLVSPIYSAIKDGHTSVRIPMFWLKNYRKDNGVFPYKVYLSDENRLYLIENYGTDNTIPLGTEITAINDVPLSTFLEGVSPYISYEQEIFRNTIIQKDLDLYLYLYFEKTDGFKLDYHSDKPHSHIVENIDYKDWKNETEATEGEREKRIEIGKPYSYKRLSNDIGIIKIYSFSVGDFSKYSVFLRETFRGIAADSIQSLIIDVRGNTGGYPKVSSDLLHYITEKYFKSMAVSELKVSKTYKKRLAIFRHNQMHFRKNLHYMDYESIIQKDVGTMVKEVDFFNEPPRKRKNEFSGDLYLLTDNRSYSASSSFAATFRCYQLGLIIGQETGGTKVFHSNSISTKLDHSNLLCIMATTRDYTACFYEEDEGIVPDLEVKPSIPGLVAKTDAALNYALFVIKKAKKLRKAEEGK